MALVEPPVPAHGHPEPAHLLQRQVQGPDGSGQHGGVGHVHGEACLGEEGAGRAGLLFPLSGQVDVPPAGEAVLQIPLALAVAEQDERPHGGGAYLARCDWTPAPPV